MKIFTMKMQQASSHYERTLLRKYEIGCFHVCHVILHCFRSMITWQIYIRNELIAKNLKHEQAATKKKIDAFLDAASTGKLWGNDQTTAISTPITVQTPTTINSAATSTRQQSKQLKTRKTPIATRASSLTRPRSAVTFGDKLSTLVRTHSDEKLDDFFQTTSPRHEADETQRA